jgi:hypothetical protein
MAKDKLHFRFNIGNDKAVCVEGGTGYGSPVLYDGVTISIRASKDNKLGARETVTHYARRNEIAAIGLAFLDVAHQMAPESTWARSETVASTHYQQRPIIPLTKQENNEIDNTLKSLGQDVTRIPRQAFTRVRERVHILQRMQYILERADDDLAHQLDLLLVCAETTGKLPFKVGVGLISVEDGLDLDQKGMQPH